jgi:hypothetical protein
MKKILLPIILISSYISAQAPAGYYDGTTGLQVMPENQTS